MPPGTMRNFQGESLTKRRKGPEGKVSWSGNGQVLTASQLFGSNPFVFAFIVDIHVCHACFFHQNEIPRAYAEAFGAHIASLLLEARSSSSWKAYNIKHTFFLFLMKS